MVPNEIKHWTRKSSRVLQNTRILDFCEATDVSPYNESDHQFVFVDSLNWVNLVPITERHEIVMVHQYRHGNQRVTLEIPGGMVDADEEPAAAAVRECLEETGYSVSTPLPLGVLNPNPALFNNALHTYYGYVSDRGQKSHRSETEKTQVELIAIEQLKPLMLDGTIDHALVCATLWRFLDQWQTEALAMQPWQHSRNR